MKKHKHITNVKKSPNNPSHGLMEVSWSRYPKNYRRQCSYLRSGGADGWVKQRKGKGKELRNGRQVQQMKCNCRE